MTIAAAQPETLSRREFAKRISVKPGYVTQLADAGRLVLTADRRRVVVAESIALIEATRDPAKAGVAARHAAARRQGGAAASPVATASASPAGSADDADVDEPRLPDNPHSLRRAKALADKEEALARRAEREEQIELGQLLRRADVESTIAGAVNTLRTSLQNLPATLAPELAAANTEERCRVLLDNGIEHALEDLARKFKHIGAPTNV